MISIFPIISQLLHVLHKFIVFSDSSVDPFLALFNSNPVIELRHKQTPLSLSLALSELCNKNISRNVEATSYWCRPAVQALIVYVSCVKKISKYCFFIFVLPSSLVFVFCYRKLTFISILSDFVFFFCLSKTFIFVLQLWKSKHQIIVLIKKNLLSIVSDLTMLLRDVIPAKEGESSVLTKHPRLLIPAPIVQSVFVTAPTSSIRN